MSVRRIIDSDIVVCARAIWIKIIASNHVDFDLVNQAKRSASSVALNFAEGNGAGGNRLRDKISVARGEAYECAVACSFLGFAQEESVALADLLDALVTQVEADRKDSPGELRG